MFRRIFELEEGFQTQGTGAVNQQLATYYSQSLPNGIPTNDPKLPLSNLTNTASLVGAGPSVGTERQPVLLNEFATYGLNPDMVKSRQAACETPGQGRDRFDHLRSLANSQDPASRVRCGWIYNNTDPQNGVGAFGVSDGPLTSKVPGTWMWDLQEAKQKVHTDLCRRVKDCGDIDAYPYQGRCGYCKTSGKAIPIEGGRVAYPNDPNASCSPNQLVTTGGSCPRVDPVAIATPEAQAARQVCDPLPNGNLTRDCLIQKVRQSGCSDDGTLIAALKSGSDLNYIDALKTNKAYTTYQSRAAIPLNETMIRQGRLTVSQALTEFNRLNEQSASKANSGLAFAARDLCLNAGEIDTFDFCVEIADSTRPPYGLDCLQKEFLRAGGQHSGKLFPTDANLVQNWNTINTWGDVKKRIQKLKEETASEDRSIQEPAMMNFLGVQLDNKTQAPFLGEPGCEIFYFTFNFRASGNPVPDSAPVFLGRRIQGKIPTIGGSVDAWGRSSGDFGDFNIRGKHGDIDPAWGISFVYLTNLRPSATKEYKISITGDDGYATVLNRPFIDPTTRQPPRNGRLIRNSSEITHVNYFPPTETNSVWLLRTNGQNVVKGFWFQAGWGLFYDFKVDNASPPPSMFSLTQDAYAPMMNFEVVSDSDMYKYGMDYFFGDRRLGDLQVKWSRTGGSPSISTLSNAQVMALGLKSGKKLLNLPYGASIATNAYFKLTSFQTFACCVVFNGVPANAAQMAANWHFDPGPTGGPLSPAKIRVYGTGDYKTGNLTMYSEFTGPYQLDMLQFEQNVAYLVLLRFRRSGRNTTGVELCLGKLKDLQKDPTKLKASSSYAVYQRAFEDEDSGVGRKLTLAGEFGISVAWCRFYDYYLEGDNLMREANDSWAGLYE